MVINCDIQFDDNPDAIFYAGQVLNGKVTLTANKIKQVKGVALKITGLAKTRWSESNGSDSSDTTYWAEVDYINTVTYLIAPSACDESVDIAPGIHTFSFACPIPSNCPSSFESSEGQIRYTIHVNLIRPWKFDRKFSKVFTVLSIKNLNYESPILKLPVKNDIIKVFGCGPCQSDPLRMEVQLPQTGFVPGQLIPVSISINNACGADINELSARLIMIIDLYSTNPTKKHKEESRTVSKLKGDPVQRFSNKQFNYLLPIPATPPSCSTLCSIIHIGYRIEVEAKINSIAYANQCVHIPITIGNVPLQMHGTVIQQQPMPKSFGIENGLPDLKNTIKVLSLTEPINNNNMVSSHKTNKENWSELLNTSPSVYMEATHIANSHPERNIDNDNDEINFTPKYPVFNFSSSTSSTEVRSDEIDGNTIPSTITDLGKTTWL